MGQQVVAWLLLAGNLGASPPASAGIAAETHPLSTNALVAPQGPVPEQRLTVLPQSEETFPAAAPETQPASVPPSRQIAPEPQPISDPLPPAFWSGLSVLVLLSGSLLLRRPKSRVR